MHSAAPLSRSSESLKYFPCKNSTCNLLVTSLDCKVHDYREKFVTSLDLCTAHEYCSHAQRDVDNVFVFSVRFLWPLY